MFFIQLSKSATSIGANNEEAQNSTLKEFLQKIRIALREANETRIWLKLFHELHLGDEVARNELLKEITEICLILGTIAIKIDNILNH